MSGWIPDVIFDKITDIPLGFLKSKGIKLLILDADNTLASHDGHNPFPGVCVWLEEAKEGEINIVLLSNNSEERVRPFAKALDLPFYAKAGKPKKRGYLKICEGYGVDPSETCGIGDQIFTDVWGANNAGILSVFVYPQAPEKLFQIKLKRILEKPILMLSRGKHYENT